MTDGGPIVTGPPPTWHCDKDAYDDASCDCGCGASDPACGDVVAPTCDVTHCGPGFVVGGTADPTMHAFCEVPGAWTCDADFFQDADCDCGCGANDLGCADATTLDACDFTWCGSPGEGHTLGGTAVDGDLAACTLPPPPVVVIDSHERHNCAILPPVGPSTSTLKCWGRNEYGQLGLGNTENRGNDPGEMGAALPVVDLGVDPSGAPFVPAVARTGINDTCVLSTTGHVKCFGRNEFGIAGRGDVLAIGNAPGEMGPALVVVPLGTDAIVTELAVGREHACARVNTPQDNNRVKCWGKGDDGRLGYEDLDGSGLVHRGNNPGEMGDALPFVNLGTVDGTATGAPLRATRLFVGGRIGCALLDDGSLKCWGGNDAGQLGLGDTNNRGNAPGEMGNALPAVKLGGALVDLAIGHDHACALLDGGRVRCFGAGGAGRLGSEGTAARGHTPTTTPDLLPDVAITDEFGTPLVVTAVTCGEDHTCVIVEGGPPGANVKCFGGNGVGELGHGDVVTRGATPGSMGAALPFTDVGGTAIAIAAGLNHTCVVLDDGRVKCWGGAEGGALGHGSGDLHLGNQPGEMGPALPAVVLE